MPRTLYRFAPLQVNPTVDICNKARRYSSQHEEVPAHTSPPIGLALSICLLMFSRENACVASVVGMRPLL